MDQMCIDIHYLVNRVAIGSTFIEIFLFQLYYSTSLLSDCCYFLDIR